MSICKRILYLVLGLILIYSSYAQDVIKWTFNVKDAFHASPIFHEGRLYVGSLDHVFYAIDANSGSEVWKFETDHEIRSTAALSDGIVCFESGNTLYGLKLDGTFLWQVTLTVGEKIVNRYDGWDYYHSSPEIVDGVAYVGTEHGWIYGVNIQNGQMVFQVQSPMPESGFRCKPIIYNDHLYIGNWEGVMYAFNINTRDLTWVYDTNEDHNHTWKNAIQTDPIIHDGNLYFAGRSCTIYSLNAVSGIQNWSFYIAPFWIGGGPIIDEGVLYAGISDGYSLYALNLNTGKRKWVTGVDWDIWTKPLIHENLIFAGSESFYAFSKESGEILKRLHIDGKILSTPSLNDGSIYFGTTSGNMMAIDEQAFLDMPISETYLKGPEIIDLGDVPINQIIVAQFYIYNSGIASDSISIKKNGASKIKKAAALNRDNFILGPNDSTLIELMIDTGELKTNRYITTLDISSQYNLINYHFKKRVQLNVIENTNLQSSMDFHPTSFTLYQNYPNPFNPQTQIQYIIPERGHIVLKSIQFTGKRS